MVTHTRLELVLPTWEAGVLTARRMGQKMVPRVETAKLHKNAENLALNTLSFA